MALDTPAKRLKWAREKHGLYKTPTEAAKAFGGKSTYLGHENGDRVPSRQKAKEYGRRYRVRWEWILEGDGPPQAKSDSIPIEGYVGAGEDVVTFDDNSSGLGDAPMSVDPNSAAVIVRGNSMYPRYFEGERIYYTKNTHDPRSLFGKECIVKLTDGRVYIKILRKGSKDGLFSLESWNAPTIEDKPIEWAAPVSWRGAK